MKAQDTVYYYYVHQCKDMELPSQRLNRHVCRHQTATGLNVDQCTILLHIGAQYSLHCTATWKTTHITTNSCHLHRPSTHPQETRPWPDMAPADGMDLWHHCWRKCSHNTRVISMHC